MNASTTARWLPESQIARDSILEQLQNILTHSSFKNSKRCCALLTYLVEHEIEGSSPHFKERTLGVEIFGRSPEYDTSSDPVVRMTASEVRKRIAQYYHEVGHEEEVRIDLPVGSYGPEFHLPVRQAPELERASHAPPAVPNDTVVGELVGNKAVFYSVLACVMLGLLGTALWLGRKGPDYSLNQFWKQVVTPPSPILVCVGTRSGTSQPPGSSPESGSQEDVDFRNLLPVSDAVAFARISGFLAKSGEIYRVESAESVTLTDLMQGPVVVVGAFNNPWTLRITDPLRFHFAAKPEAEHWIADRKNPAAQYVEDQGTLPGRDYAIIGRIRNGVTGQISVIAAGLGAAGTAAASEFVTSNRDMDYLTQQIPKSSSSKNVEAVISIEVVGDRPGAPHIEAVEVW